MLQKSSIWITAGIFFENPMKKMYLLEVSRELKLAHTSVKRNLGLLAKWGIIRKEVEKKGSRRFPVYQANTNTNIYRTHKRIYNITSIIESGLIEYIEEKIMPRSIVLFGSYCRGEDIEVSDIDLYVEAPETLLMVDTFQRLLHRKIQIHCNESFASYPKELQNNIINGMVLYGYLEAIK